MSDVRKRMDYDEWHRLRRKPNSKREEVIRAFSEAWANGKSFSIVLHDTGDVRIKSGNRIIGTYQDAAAFARDFFPEALE